MYLHSLVSPLYFQKAEQPMNNNRLNMILILHHYELLTCQGYSPIVVAQPPTILVDPIVFGTPHSNNIYTCEKLKGIQKIKKKLTALSYCIFWMNIHIGW